MLTEISRCPGIQNSKSWNQKSSEIKEIELQYQLEPEVAECAQTPHIILQQHFSSFEQPPSNSDLFWVFHYAELMSWHKPASAAAGM